MGLIKDLHEMDDCFLSGTLDVPLFGGQIEVEIDRGSGRLVRIGHIKNAFWQTEDYARF